MAKESCNYLPNTLVRTAELAVEHSSPPKTGPSPGAPRGTLGKPGDRLLEAGQPRSGGWPGTAEAAESSVRERAWPGQGPSISYMEGPCLRVSPGLIHAPPDYVAS